MTLKEARRKKSLTIRALAKKVGVSRQTIIHYETDKCQPSDEKWDRLVKILGLKGKNAQKSKYFRKRKPTKLYDSNSVCKRPSCNKQAESRGYCHSHYIIHVWRKRDG
jgi:transcriptional regulator with XRE-family HTH domain